MIYTCILCSRYRSFFSLIVGNVLYYAIVYMRECNNSLALPFSFYRIYICGKLSLEVYEYYDICVHLDII